MMDKCFQNRELGAGDGKIQGFGPAEIDWIWVRGGVPLAYVLSGYGPVDVRLEV